MKNILFTISLIIYLANNAYTQETTYDLTVSISGMKTEKGKVFVAVYSSSETFLNDDKMTKSGTAIVVKSKAEITFKNLKKGEYAVSVFHDENDNKKMDTKIFGIPKEPYGFSNDSKGFMGPPEFDDAKFTLNANKTVSITVK